MKLEICNVSKRYGSTLALNGVSAELTNGLYGLLGPNGAGKTTLIGTITTLLAPTAGLDPKERVRFRNIISKLSSDRIIILATHIVSDIECVAKEVILLKEGRLLQKASPLTLQNALCGKVWSLPAAESELERYMAQYVIANAAADGGRYLLRVIAESCPHPEAKPESPRLEDVYLYYFGETA